MRHTLTSLATTQDVWSGAGRWQGVNRTTTAYTRWQQNQQQRRTTWGTRRKARNVRSRCHHARPCERSVCDNQEMRIENCNWFFFKYLKFSMTRSLMLSRQQKRDQSEELHFQQLARHRTTSTHQVSPRSGVPCWKTRGACGGGWQRPPFLSNTHTELEFYLPSRSGWRQTHVSRTDVQHGWAAC